MPRFHFNVVDGASLVDATGVECSDFAEAQRLAIETAGSAIARSKPNDWSDKHWEIQVLSDVGLLLCSFIFTQINAPATVAE